MHGLKLVMTGGGWSSEESGEVQGAKVRGSRQLHGRPEAREIQEEEDEEYLHVRRQQALNNQRKDLNWAHQGAETHHGEKRET